jgi:hypothetical protein
MKIKEGVKNTMKNELKAIIDKTIEMEYFELGKSNFEDMTEDEKIDHDKQYEKTLKLQDKLEEMLTGEQRKVLMEYNEELIGLSDMEQNYMFNRGVKMELNKLSYIKEILGEGTSLL